MPGMMKDFNSTVLHKEILDMVEYSYRALYMKFVQGSWIEMCNNDCGTIVYFDKEQNAVRNAAKVDKDCFHKDVCDFLKKLRLRARAFNWYPSFAIDIPLTNVLVAADNLYDAEEIVKEKYDHLRRRIQELKVVIKDQWEQNKNAKVEWEKEKLTKLDAKKQTDRSSERYKEQLQQWRVYDYERIQKEQQAPDFVRGSEL
jgi:hypothetical protein